MARAAPAKPHDRNGIWYFRKRVPKRYAALEPRNQVWISTGIPVKEDPGATKARLAIQELSAGLEEAWRMKAQGRADSARQQFEAARARARSLQLPYLTNTEIAAAPVDEILKRIDMLASRSAGDDAQEVAAVMGGADRPAFRLSTLMAEYESIRRAELIKRRKSPNQIRKWRNPRIRAIQYFMDLVGDKPLTQISRSDAFCYRDWWESRVLDHDLKLATANKSIGLLAKMLKDIDLRYQLKLDPVFADLRFAGATDGKRPAFTAEHVQTAILAPGALGGLDAQAMAIVWVCAEIGARPSEIANLAARKIFLDAPVPFIRLVGDDRELKTHSSERDIPLVGYALRAFQVFPDGFARYRDREDALSAVVNKNLRQDGLLPTPEHSLYSLRHTFEDRLTALDPPDKIIAALMGHAFQRERYGEGPSLEQKQRWLQKIAFKVPGDPPQA